MFLGHIGLGINRPLDTNSDKKSIIARKETCSIPGNHFSVPLYMDAIRCLGLTVCVHLVNYSSKLL